MAIIDSNAVLFEGALTTSSQGRAVPLTALKLPGRMEAMPLRISVTEAFVASEVQKLAFTLEEADSATGSWTAVPGASWDYKGDALALGARLGPRFLPQGVRKSWIRLNFTVQTASSISKGKLFAALQREEDFPYEAVLQVK